MKAGVYVTPCGSVILETRARVVEHFARSSNLSAGKAGLSGLTGMVDALVATLELPGCCSSLVSSVSDGLEEREAGPSDRLELQTRAGADGGQDASAGRSSSGLSFDSARLDWAGLDY